MKTDDKVKLIISKIEHLIDRRGHKEYDCDDIFNENKKEAYNVILEILKKYDCVNFTIEGDKLVRIIDFKRNDSTKI